MAQHARPVGPTTNAAAGFSPEMATGYGPDRPLRYESRNRPAVCVSQTTHVPASAVPPMHQLVPTVVARRIKPYAVGATSIPPDVLNFSSETAQGSLPARPRLFLAPRIQLPVSQPTHTVAPFGLEMVSGWHADRNRAFVPPSLGWQTSQPTHVSAAFSPEMAQGWTPSRSGRLTPFTIGSTLLPADVLLFSIEMVQGCRPTSPRLFLAPRLPLPWSQTTPIQAAFTSSMASGWVPPTSRPSKPFTTGLAVAAPQIAVFSVEMAQGWLPSSPRLFKAPRLGVSPAQVTHVQATFGPEMVAGWRPERNRAWLPLRIGRQEYPITNTPAVFTPDMVAGCLPTRSRAWLPLRTGWPQFRGFESFGEIANLVSFDVNLCRLETWLSGHVAAERFDALAARTDTWSARVARKDAFTVRIDDDENWETER